MPLPTRRLAAVLLPVGLAASACSGSSRPTVPLAHLRFDASVRVVGADGTDSSGAGAAAGEGTRIIGTITEWYQSAFVDPKGWRDPAFPAVVDNFSGAARDKVRGEIAAVTIASIRADVVGLTPGKATLGLTIYDDASGAGSYAVASAFFDGIALTKSASRVHVKQSGTYYLRPDASGSWKVFSYVARAEAATLTAPITSSVSASVSPASSPVVSTGSSP